MDSKDRDWDFRKLMKDIEFLEDEELMGLVRCLTYDMERKERVGEPEGSVSWWQEIPPPIPQPQSETESPNAAPENQKQQRILRGERPDPEKLEDIICRMMASRAWTTRLQNSIRDLVPEFDHSLVYNVLHGARNSEHALQFFRWVERAGLFRHDRGTHMKIIEILGRASKLNHARCILLDMPKNGVEWDEDMFVVLIESYGKAGIVQEAVKIFQKMNELGVERTVKSYDTLFKVILRRGRYDG
ncbi:hypothetical protein GH714_028103 [Hevea brasiliensis]|uniref:Pentacotripeptide-repeat region of PRORP domain-containing protein n=1 Tax=Hevea brasiliensis TaxID=3981 RepID=A0A6A6MGS0_HEVBR|nr:hypothetical protein GH714_028103 [Hevea brasiliensis]